MSKNFLIIPLFKSQESERLEVSSDFIANITGAPGGVIREDAYGDRAKFAFYYCGELCEVVFNDGSHLLQVFCHANNDDRSKDIREYVKNNIKNTLTFRGYQVNFYGAIVEINRPSEQE